MIRANIIKVALYGINGNTQTWRNLTLWLGDYRKQMASGGVGVD
jgi:hypothetical protein